MNKQLQLLLEILSPIVGLTLTFVFSVLIFRMQLNFFHSRAPRRSQDSPSSFYELKKFAPPIRLRALTYLFAVPFSLLFVVVSLRFLAIDAGPKAIVHSIEAFAKMLWHHLDEAWEVELWNYVPFVSPLPLFVFTLLLFAALHKPMGVFRDVVVGTIGLGEHADAAAKRAATLVMRNMSYNEAVSRLEAAYSGYLRTAPLPEELTSASLHARLSYQLLFFSQYEKELGGLEASLARALSAIEVQPPVEWTEVKSAESAQALGSPDWSYITPLVAALSFYVVLCAVYWSVAPFADPWLKDNLVVRALLPAIEWASDRDWLARELVSQTLGFVVPLAAGMYLYSARRAQRSKRESSLDTMRVVVGIQYVSSFIVWFAIGTLYVTLYLLNQTSAKSVPFTFTSLHFWIQPLIAAAAPGIALFAWRIGGKSRIRGFGFAAACFAAAFLFLLSQSASEWLAHDHRGFYWHQMVLGGFLTAAYYLAALFAKDVLLPPAGPNEDLLRPLDETPPPPEIRSAAT